MGLIKWIKRELDSSNSCKRRQSEPPLSGNSGQPPRDESYVKALSKFNEWRHRQQFGGSVRLSRKQSKKLIERRGQSEQFFEKRYTGNDIVNLQSKNHTDTDNGLLYEEILINTLDQKQNDFSSSPAKNIYEKTSVHHSFQTTDIAKTKRRSSVNKKNDSQIYENVIAELIDQFDQSPDIININKNFLSPPVQFFKDNSNPFANVHTPIRSHHHQELEKSTKSNDDWVYESPRNLKSLDALRANFKPFEADEDRIPAPSIPSDRRLSKNPPYQTVINKHGEEVEYALPLNEKIDEEAEENRLESDFRIVAPNSTSSCQQYVDDNFQFLNENDRLGLSRISVSFSNNQFQRGNVVITDLDGTTGTKATDDQNNSKGRNILQELESLEVWSRNISNSIERNIVKKTTTDMHFAEIIVCNTNEVSEKSPREVFETLNGTLHLGTFHCIPVTQFKSKQSPFADNTLQLNYEILRKIRHPDIALLMGITVDNKCALDSLILEPVDFSLHHYIHQEGGCIPITICLLYTLQINNAVTYLHKHGLIHSNISTHSVVMCHLSKAVKLTSFELTTTLNGDLRDELMEVYQRGKYENELLRSTNELPPKLRPYNIEYRQMFSKHNYQAPELLSNRIPFVFPKIQSDVYGICLMLWEMINCSTPYADFDYDEMTKLIYLQNAQLPILREKRQKSFEGVLQSGLHMLAEKRFADTIRLNEALNELSLESNDKIDSSYEGEKQILKKHPSEGISSLLCNKGFGPMISERTSTIKKRKHVFKDNRLSARQLFVYSQTNKSNEPSEMMVSQTSSPNSPQYGFEIGEVSIPETPIARSNKLRKTAWLSNQSISPIVHLEINSNDGDAAINQIKIVENNVYNALSSENTSTSKLYNVNIRIRPTSKKTDEDGDSQSPAKNSSLDQVQKNLSQISDYIRFFNLASTQNPKPLVHTPAKTQSPVENLVNYNTTSSKPAKMTEKKLNQQTESGIVNENSINEFFCRNHQTADFESSLWHREKQKCDQGVKSQRRISVKDAVNKFESFSKSMLSDSSSPKPKKTIQSVTSRFDEKNNVHSSYESSKSGAENEKNISKLDVILQNKSVKDDDIKEKDAVEIIKAQVDSERITESQEQSKQSPMLTLNFKKLDRRASDIGSYYIRQKNPTTKALTARHSIYGSEIFKRLRKTKTSTGNEAEDNTANKTYNSAFNTKVFHDKNKDFKIKVGKLTCLNCGHKLFVVDDIVPSNNGDDANETFSELLLTPLNRNHRVQHVSKSTEDFYIDDDFCEDIELCANMELGTQTQFSDFDFDIFSAEIFNASEEKQSHLT